jgi:predicted nucleic acid-binding Zn ribbon protein
MTATIERPCVGCGRPIAVTTRNPNRRFCSSRCRIADWHARNDRPTDAVPNAVTNAVPNTVPAANDAPNAVGPQANNVSTTNGVAAANGVQRCPNCHHELAIIAVVVPANAAHIRTPEVITTNTT